MLLLFSHRVSPRLEYICNFIFGEQLGLQFSIITDLAELNRHQGPAIIYADLDSVPEKGFKISPHTLLFQNDICEQNTELTSYMDLPCFFRNESDAFGFDILAASFYLLSRYEEYLPHKKDEFGRYSHKESLAFRHGFIKRPLINEWLQLLEDRLLDFFPEMKIQKKRFFYLPTYDIDMAYAYRGKSLFRNLGGFLKRPEWERIRVLNGKAKDPFDSYEWMDSLHTKSRLHPIYFILTAKTRGPLDKNIDPSSPEMKKLIQHLTGKYELGLHPSWQSNFESTLLIREKKRLEKLAAVNISRSRQHYIRFTLPETYREVLKTGITQEFSMGYGTVNGFRASFAGSFQWYDLEEETTTGLRIYPFCFMEANCYYEQRQNAVAAAEEIRYYYEICKKTDGLFISIFHNQFLGTHADFTQWREMYEDFISQVQ